MFKALELGDKKLFDNYKEWGISHSQYNFTNLFMWKHEFNPVIDVYDGFLCIVITTDGEKRALFPLGNGDAGRALRYIVSCFGNISFTALDDAKIESLASCLSNRFQCIDSRDFYDYVYFTEKLTQLSGKKLHSKRNHLKSFLNNYTFTFEKITKDRLDDCEFIEKKWIESKKGVFSPKDSSYISTKRLLDNFEELGCVGGIIYVDGFPAAFSIGEYMGNDFCVVHIEKAIDTYKGIYTAINQMCAEKIFCDSKYINREEDMGIDALRKAKLSYYPDLMLEYKIVRFLP